MRARDILRTTREAAHMLRVERRSGMASHDRGMDWFLAQVKPNCAQIAERNLRRQGFETFMPLEEETRKRNNRFVTTERPLFPGYLFVAFNLASDLWRSVNSTHGISRLVSFGKEPTAVPPGLVSELRRRCASNGKLLSPNLMSPGDQVSLTKGPFAGFVAEVEQIAPDRRVWVLMEIMGGHTRIAVEADQLRARTPNSQGLRSRPREVTRP